LPRSSRLPPSSREALLSIIIGRRAPLRASGLRTSSMDDALAPLLSAGLASQRLRRRGGRRLHDRRIPRIGLRNGEFGGDPAISRALYPWTRSRTTLSVEPKRRRSAAAHRCESSVNPIIL
jgi:hypothetical protein